jgi:predicted ATPase
MHMLKHIDLKGYKSIKDISLDLRPLNVFIGANGSGKSNLVSFFKLLNYMMAGLLREFVATSGNANSLLHYGAKETPQIEATLRFGYGDSDINYRMRLGHAAEDTLIFREESIYDSDQKQSGEGSSGHRETTLLMTMRPSRMDDVSQMLRGVRIFQFDDTSDRAPIRHTCDINDNSYLLAEGGNLAAVLYKIQQTAPECYQRIVGTIRQIAPFFSDFNLAPSALNPNVIQLRWRERDRDYNFGPHLLSDGTLRAMALVTLLLQPTKDLPSVIIIDEPELGLHPYALATLAGLLRSASVHSQIMVATESATLLDQFEPQDVVVTERCKGETVFKRLDSKDLQEWRQEYCLSELWEKNVIGGRPSR